MFLLIVLYALYIAVRHIKEKDNFWEGIMLPVLTFKSDCLKWNEAEQYMIQAVRVSYWKVIRETRQEWVGIGEVYESCGMTETTAGMMCVIGMEQCIVTVWTYEESTRRSDSNVSYRREKSRRKWKVRPGKEQRSKIRKLLSGIMSALK